MKILFLFLGIISSAHASDFKSLDDYQRCQEKKTSGSICHEALEKWVKKHPNDAFAAGKLTRLYMNHWLGLPFFARAINDTNFDCKDPDLRLSVLGALNLPKTGNEKLIQDAENIAFVKCEKELKEPVNQAAVLDSNTFANVCGKLKLTGLKKSKCEDLNL